ncbi:MAG: hypothetical protein AAF236_02215 [Verrucomicrobiota bacterium]
MTPIPIRSAVSRVGRWFALQFIDSAPPADYESVPIEFLQNHSEDPFVMTLLTECFDACPPGDSTAWALADLLACELRHRQPIQRDPRRDNIVEFPAS